MASDTARQAELARQTSAQGCCRGVTFADICESVTLGKPYGRDRKVRIDAGPLSISPRPALCWVECIPESTVHSRKNHRRLDRVSPVGNAT